MKHIKKLSALLMCALIALSACITASAANTAIKDTSKQCSLTVHVYQNKTNGALTTFTSTGEQLNSTTLTDAGYVPLKGVKFELKNGSKTYTGTTGDDGSYKFANLAQGNYTLKATVLPAACNGTISDSTFTLPMTNPSENGFIYDAHVYPKIQTVYGDVTVTKVDAANDTALSGAKFTLYSNSSCTQQYQAAASYGATSLTSVFTTNNEGKFTIYSLPKGTYYLKETTPPAGYVLDSKVLTIQVPGTGNTYNSGTFAYQISQKVSNTKAGTGSKTVDEKNVAVGDTVNYTISLPTDLYYAGANGFKVTDTLNAALTPENVAVSVTGTTLTANTDYTISKSGQIVTVQFNLSAMSKLAAATEIKITIQATVSKMTQELLNGITNTAKLSNGFDLTITTDDSNKVKTGSTKFKKIDGTSGTNGLANAKFKVYSDANCTNEVSFYTSATAPNSVKEITTTSTGEFTIFGLDPDRTYYLLETQAPDGYQLNGAKISFQPTAGGDKTLDAQHTIVNEKKVELPFTGGVGAEVVVASGVLLMVAACFVLKKRVK